MQQQQKHHQKNWSSSLIAVVAFFDNLWKIRMYVITNWGRSGRTESKWLLIIIKGTKSNHEWDGNKDMTKQNI